MGKAGLGPDQRGLKSCAPQQEESVEVTLENSGHTEKQRCYCPGLCIFSQKHHVYQIVSLYLEVHIQDNLNEMTVNSCFNLEYALLSCCGRVVFDFMEKFSYYLDKC